MHGLSRSTRSLRVTATPLSTLRFDRSIQPSPPTDQTRRSPTSAPPRRRAGEGPLDLPFRVDDLDARRTLPVLVRKQPEGRSRKSAKGAGVGRRARAGYANDDET